MTKSTLKNINISSSLRVEGLDIQVIRKNIKNWHLSIQPPEGEIRITAPLLTSDGAIRSIIISKMKWIKEKKALFDRKGRRSSSYENGDTLYIWGKPYTLELTQAARSKVYIDGDRIILSGKSEDKKAKERTILEFRRKLLKEEAESLLTKWELITGLKCKQLRTKSMKTRWGTCNSAEGRIWLSILLTEKPLICLDYVLLHEINHIAVANHSASFLRRMDKYMPDWRRIKALLNEK